MRGSHGSATCQNIVLHLRQRARAQDVFGRAHTSPTKSSARLDLAPRTRRPYPNLGIALSLNWDKKSNEINVRPFAIKCDILLLIAMQLPVILR